MFLYFKIENGKLLQIDDASNANWIHITPPFVAKDLEQFALKINMPIHILQIVWIYMNNHDMKLERN